MKYFLYRVKLSNGYDTVIRCSGDLTKGLQDIWDIASCWYENLDGVTIVEITQMDETK